MSNKKKKNRNFIIILLVVVVLALLFFSFRKKDDKKEAPKSGGGGSAPKDEQLEYFKTIPRIRLTSVEPFGKALDVNLNSYVSDVSGMGNSEFTRVGSVPLQNALSASEEEFKKIYLYLEGKVYTYKGFKSYNEMKAFYDSRVWLV